MTSRSTNTTTVEPRNNVSTRRLYGANVHNISTGNTIAAAAAAAATVATPGHECSDVGAAVIQHYDDTGFV